MQRLLLPQQLVNRSRLFDWLAPLAFRLYLVPVFWMAGINKLQGFDDTVAWFGNSEWGLGLPFPWLMAFLATASELGGALLLLVGLGVRWVSVPLMVTMAVAIVTVHWPNGWQAIADPSAPFANAQVLASADKLAKARELLQEHGHYDWLTSSGPLVILNNGYEFAATYFIMLLSLFFSGAGRYLSVDHWFSRYLERRSAKAGAVSAQALG